ncbi:hypothetical protein ACXDR4_003179 [Klebsiella pneumoniae]
MHDDRVGDGMNIETVNELIKSLESAGELSIKETKVMALAKAFKQLAAENLSICETIEAVRGVADNSSGIAGWHLNGEIAKWSEILSEIDDIETPATDRIVAGIKADEEKAVLNDLLRHLDKIDIENLSSPWELSSEVVAFVNSRLLREGGRQMSKSYIVILQYLWCNETGGGIEYTSDCAKFDKRDMAIKHGFKLRESDDFNIGVIEGGKLISFDWMDKPVGESEDTLAKIAELIGLEDAS